jgi:hypothetical protein
LGAGSQNRTFLISRVKRTIRQLLKYRIQRKRAKRRRRKASDGLPGILESLLDEQILLTGNLAPSPLCAFIVTIE